MDMVAASKLLDFHAEKSCFVVFGDKGSRQAVLDDLEGRPLTLSGKAMPQQNAAKYLGDYLSASGLSDSVKVTVMKRKPQVTRAIYEIRAVIDDCRSQIVGGLTAGFQLWDMAVLPMLLFNAECWLEIDNTTINILEQLQYTFL